MVWGLEKARSVFEEIASALSGKQRIGGRKTPAPVQASLAFGRSLRRFGGALATGILFMAIMPTNAWALSTACAAINNGQYVPNGRAGGQNPTAMSGTYGFIAPNGADENITTSANLADTFTPGEIISWSYTKTTNAYLHIYLTDSNYNLITGTGSYDRTAASGSGSFSIVNSNDIVGVRLDAGSFGGGPNISGPTNGTANVTISCSAPTPVLGVAMAHSGNASQGGSLAYTITPSTTVAPTSTATLTASFTLPTGMTYTSATGTGWSCSGSGQTGSCTRTASIGTGNGPTITLNTSFASNATTPLVPQVQLSGGGASNTPTATDSTVVNQTPTITGISPTAGPTGGSTAVTITGTNFTGTSGAGGVKFGGTNATGYTVFSSTQINATAPAGAAGTVDITVTNAGLTSPTNSNDQYTYVAAPTVTAVSPIAGPTAGGTTVVITGTGFLAAPGTGAVKFGAANATYTINSNTQITATSPANSAGTYDVTVATPGGTSATSAADQFTYIPAPTITSITPTAGPLGGGTSVTITGTNFTGVSAVTFGGTAASGFTFNSATSITATSPAGSAGTVDIRVTTGGGTSATGSSDQFTYIAAPTVTAVSPIAGPTAGGTTVVITGTGFLAAPGTGAVKFGAANATYTINSDTQITVSSTPANSAGTYDVTVTTPGGTSATSSSDQYTYVAAPTVTSVSPTAGPTSGGTTVTITGTGFSAAPGTGAVKFGATTAAYTINSNTQITVSNSPASAAGTYDITVATPGGTSATSAADQYTYVAPPVANSYTASAVAYDISNTTFSVASHATNSPTNYAVGSATTAQGGSVTVDSSGTVTYTAPSGFRGNDSFTFTATNLGGTSAPATVTVPVSNPTLLFTFPVGGGTRGIALSNVRIDTTGGRAPYSCATTLNTGSLPAGTQLNADCTITGTPAASGTFTFTATVTDSSLGTGPYTLSTGPMVLTINAPTLSISPASGALPGATVGTGYSQSFTASGGTAGYTYARTLGTLPTGVTLSGGTISGTPTATGTFNFDITATDSSTAGSGGPYTRTQSYSVTVSQGFQTITFGPLADTSLSNSPVTVSATASSGLTVSFASTTTGICTVSGTTVTLLARGTCSITASQAGDGNWTAAPDVVQSFTVTPANLVLTDNAATGLQVGASYSQTNPASGGVAPYTYALNAGAFVPGTTLNSSTGEVSGTPTVAGSFSYQLKVTDSQPVTSPPGSVVTVNIAKGNQTISFTSTAPGASVGGTAYTPTASTPSGLTVTFTIDASSAAICTISGGSVTFQATGTCLINANQAGDTNWNAAAQVQQSVTVGAAGAITTTVSFSTASLGVGQTGTATITFTNPNASASPNIAPLFSGSALVSRGALGGSCGASGSDSGANFQFNGFSIPAGSCTVTINYTGTTAGSSAGFSLGAFTPAGYPTTSAKGSGAFAVVPTVTGVSPNTGPVSQVVTISGTGFSTTPGNNTVTFGSAGNGNVTAASATSLTVTAPAAGSGAKAVTVSVNGQTSTTSATFTFIDKPIAANKPGVSVPYNSAGTAIDLSSSITGGPHSSIAIGTAAQHGTTTIAGDVVTYTPTAGYFGTDNFTYTATGAGGTSNIAQVDITVATPAAPVAADKSGVAIPYNGTGTGIDLSTSITGVHSTIAIGTPPQHGSVSIAGDVVTYTPTTNYYGADSFTYTATGPGGTSAPATVSVTVANPPAPVAADKNGVTVPYASGGTAIDLSTSITGVHSGIAVGTVPAHGTVTVAGDVATYTPNATYYGADSFTYTATGPGGTSAPATVNITVGLPPAPVSADKNGVAVPYASTGTAIDLSGSITGVHSGVMVGTAPAHGTTTVAGDVITYTPSATYYGADSFTYTATGPGGASNVSTVSVTVATPAAPVAANKAGVAVPYASTGTAIDLASSITGVHSSIAIGTAPAHGTVTVAGDVVTYTPSATYYGADSFTYTATGPGGTSPPATVSITVGLPPAPVAADKSGVAVPYASAGTAIDLSGSVTGVHASIAIGTAPAHGTVTVAGDVLTYTPAATYYGADSFTYTATGPGGTSAPATVSLTVATPAAPTAANKSGVTVGYNSAGTAIDLAPSVSGVHSALTVATAPTHGTTTVNGDVVTYTPTAGYYGADSFTYTVTGPGGTSAAATVSLTVATPPPPAAAPGTGSVAGSTTTAGTSVSINLSALVTGVYDTIQIASHPQHGTVTLSAVAGPSLNPTAAAPASPYIAVYTPAPNYAGTDSFTFTATGPGGTSSPATVTITVVGQVPVAVAKVANTGDGQMVSVMLTDGAIRGPFTGATVVSVSPASSASTAIVATGNGGYRLDVTPNNRFGGQIVVTYTLSNVFGASAPSTVTLTVQARPDPRNDPNVGAISDAQSEATRRFARAQVSNFMRRAEQLHNGGGQAGLAMGMTLNSRDGMVGMQRPDDKNWGLAITDRMRASGEDPAIGRFANNPQSPLSRPDQLGYGRAIGPNGDGTPRAGASKKTADTNEDGTRRTGSVATWAGGAIDIGTRDKTTDRTKVTATTAGLSAGADVKLADGIVVGLGGGYGNDLSRIGTAAQVRGTSTIYAAYASVQPAEGTFIDGVIGRGQLDFTTRRIAAAVNATARGSRDGSYTVAAISLGIDRNGGGALQWSLYGRGEYMDADLDAYAESGAGRYNLRFDAREVRSITGTIGGRIEYRQKMGFGSVTPRVRAEWNHEFADVDAQWLDYADIPGAAAYALTGNGWKREQLQLSLGARFDILKGGWSFDFETGLRTGQGEKAGTLQIRITKTF